MQRGADETDRGRTPALQHHSTRWVHLHRAVPIVLDGLDLNLPSAHDRYKKRGGGGGEGGLGSYGCEKSEGWSRVRTAGSGGPRWDVNEMPALGSGRSNLRSRRRDCLETFASNGEEAEEMSSEDQSYISPLDRYRLRVEGKLENISAMDQK